MLVFFQPNSKKHPPYYDVKWYCLNYEPFFVGRTNEAPDFDERFRGYGYQRDIQVI